MRRYLSWLAVVLAACLSFWSNPAAAAVCAPATSQGTAPASWQTYCWLDFSTYNDATARSPAGQNFSYTLSDGATLTFNVRVTPAAGNAFQSIAAPSWTGAAVGNTAFLGIPGRPILYTVNAGVSTIAITNILVTPPPGSPAVTAYAFVAADAESTDNGESLQFVTNGGGWTVLDQVNPISGSTYPTITGVNTGTVTMAGNGQPSPIGGYIIGSNSPTSVTTTLTAGGLQGVMFAVRFASIRLTKTITGARIAANDQFKFDITATSNGTVLATGTTTGTGNGPFTAAAVSLASGIPLTLTESMAAGSTSALSSYSARLTCTNSTPGSSTVMPNNVATTSYNFGALQFGDAVQCTFNNAAFPHVQLQKALGTGGRRFSTDQFTVQIRNGATVVAAATTSGTGTTVTGGNTGLTQLAAGTAYTLTEIAASGSLAQYNATLACTNAATGSSTALPSTVGGTIQPQLGDVVTCIITNTRRASNATLTVSKASAAFSDPVNGTTNAKMIPGGDVRYTISVANTGNQTVDASTIVITDPLPANVTYNVGAGVTFANGAITSGLSFNATTDVRFSNAVAAPANFAACTYTPTGPYDAAVRHICVRPSGTMAAATAAGQPSFSIAFRVRIN